VEAVVVKAGTVRVGALDAFAAQSGKLADRRP
jgi:hypothetical protein